MSIRLHTELLVQVATDLAIEHIRGQFDTEQNQDNLVKTVGPMGVQVGAGVSNSQIVFPGGVTTLRFLAITDVDSADGVHVLLNGTGTDPVVVKPPIGTDLVGEMVVTTTATSLYLTNPSVTTDVNLSLLMGFANT